MNESFPHQVDIADALTGRRTSSVVQNLAREANVLAFADVLSSLANHASQMAARDEEDKHDRCVECETLKLLYRCVSFGDQMVHMDKPFSSVTLGEPR